MSRSIIVPGACAGLLLAAGAALAQVPTISPRGDDPPPPAPQPPAPQPIIVNVPGQQAPTGDTQAGQPAAPQTNWYFGDADLAPERDTWQVGTHGPVPEHHVVRQGDTLWDISWIYYNDPWDWPKVWSYNPSITNPHWIYPGDLVRLYPQGQGPVVVYDADPDSPVDVGAVPTVLQTGGVTLRQLAYVDREKLKYAARIDGAVEEKAMLSVGDQVYLSYPPDHPPKVGARYAIYTEKKPVNHPTKKSKVGSYVRILGELTVLSVKKDKLARAVIEEANDVIERGALVGPLQRQYRGDAVKVEPATRDLQGTVVAMLHKDELIGEGELIFVDLGRDDQLKKGNLMHMVRRGDAYAPVAGPKSSAGQDDRDYPSRSIGRCIVVDVGRSASGCLVIAASQEIEIGDQVLMQADKK